MDREPHSAAALAAFAAVALGTACVIPGLQSPLAFDGGYAYLPMAAHLLDEGAAYLNRPASLATGIVAFAWPALLGAQESAVRVANVVLYGALIALAFTAVRAAHSARAGVVAAFLVAASPVIHPYIPDVMTEAPFFFLIGLWMAALAAVARGSSTPAVLVGGAAFALATFTRPVTTFFPLGAAILFAWRAWRRPPGERAVEARIALMHAVAALLVGAFIARNAIEFGYPGVATGAGNALFHGVNALVDGFDPTYYGLTYDDGAATRGAFHLSIEGDRMLRHVAFAELAATPLPVTLEMAARKSIAFVFVAAQHWDAPFLRAWRTALVVFALAAVILRWRSPLVIALALFATYLVAAHLPVFYLHRYSAPLDLPLALLAGIGIAEAWARPARVAGLAIGALLAVAIGFELLAIPGPGSPHPERSPVEEAWRHAPVTLRGNPGEAAIELPVTGAPRLNPHAQSVVTFRAAITPARRGSCAALRLGYKGFGDRAYDPRRTVRVPVRDDGAPHEVTVGAYAPLALNHEGVLRLELECDTSASAEIGTMRILEPVRASYYRDRYLGRRENH